MVRAAYTQEPRRPDLRPRLKRLQLSRGGALPGRARRGLHRLWRLPWVCRVAPPQFVGRGGHELWQVGRRAARGLLLCGRRGRREPRRGSVPTPGRVSRPMGMQDRLSALPALEERLKELERCCSRAPASARSTNPSPPALHSPRGRPGCSAAAEASAAGGKSAASTRGSGRGTGHGPCLALPRGSRRASTARP